MARSRTPARFAIPGDLIDFILLGPVDDRRQLQDSPILGDVWLAFAADPAGVHDLLITPHKATTSATVAGAIAEQLEPGGSQAERRSNIAYLQGIVAARLSLREVLTVVVPMTQWWDERRALAELERDFNRTDLQRRIKALFAAARASYAAPPLPLPGPTSAAESLSALERYVVLAGLLLWASRITVPRRAGGMSVDAFLELAGKQVRAIVDLLIELHAELTAPPPPARRPRSIFQVSLNRRTLPALERSVPAVKGDAARTLFRVDCSRITWAVIDSGIDGRHPAFAGADGASRVKKTFDFTRLRELLSSDSDQLSAARLTELLDGTAIGEKEGRRLLARIRADAKQRRPTNWDAIEELLLLTAPPVPVSFHGTHVAGIIGATAVGRNPERRADDVASARGQTAATALAAGSVAGKAGLEASEAPGMCPDIHLWDFRVLAKTAQDTEFAVMAALQYIRYVNERHSYITVHGANLSLSIPHNVRNFACGHTPVCRECERLVNSGVVVVAAAGNRGYQSFATKDGVFENYAAFSITDPGNADAVITVGATHGNWPHTYGVSFFSSRGPTGDGRMKPDLVAPGERVKAPVPGGYGAESGTSMAAPHVSGAAAMLMARYAELIGDPRRIKQLLCASATDLGRERSFQGHGMLDVLRAFQSI